MTNKNKVIDLTKNDKFMQSQRANYYAEQELADFEEFVKILEEQFKKTYIFQDVDFQEVKREYLESVRETYFDENTNKLREEIVPDLLEYYDRMFKFAENPEYDPYAEY